MDNIEGNIAVYNEHVDFIIKFVAPNSNEIYKSFIIEEKLHRALTFNYKNSIIKADGEIIEGDFRYDYKENMLKIEFDNPASQKDMEIEIKIAANITNLAAIVESNYRISNAAELKIKGYENTKALITKSNIININFNSVKIDIYTDIINDIIPAIDGQKIKCHASFNTLDTNANYDILVKNILGNNLAFEDDESQVFIDGINIENRKFTLNGNDASIIFHNSSEIKNKKIEIVVCSTIKNSHTIENNLTNEFILYINNIECSRSVVNITVIKPISEIINIFLSDK